MTQKEKKIKKEMLRQNLYCSLYCTDLILTSANETLNSCKLRLARINRNKYLFCNFRYSSLASPEFCLKLQS